MQPKQQKLILFQGKTKLLKLLALKIFFFAKDVALLNFLAIHYETVLHFNRNPIGWVSWHVRKCEVEEMEVFKKKQIRFFGLDRDGLLEIGVRSLEERAFLQLKQFNKRECDFSGSICLWR